MIWRRKTLDNQEIRAALDRHWKATVALDLDKAHEIYHDDVIVEFPQSGERISVNATYTNSEHITLPKLVSRSCGRVEKELSGSLNTLLLMMVDVQSMSYAS